MASLYDLLKDRDPNELKKLLGMSKDEPTQPEEAFPMPNGGLEGNDLAAMQRTNPGSKATVGSNLNVEDRKPASEDHEEAAKAIDEAKDLSDVGPKDEPNPEDNKSPEKEPEDKSDVGPHEEHIPSIDDSGVVPPHDEEPLSPYSDNTPTDLVPGPNGGASASWTPADESKPNTYEDMLNAMWAETHKGQPSERSIASNNKETPEVQKQSQTQPYQSGLQSLLDRIYGPSSHALADAFVAQHAAQQKANALRTGEKFAAAFSRLRGGAYKADNTFANAIENQGNEQIANAITQRKAAEEGVGTASKLSELDDKSKLQDASSDVSQAYRNMAKVYSPSLSRVPGFDKMTAEQIKAAQPMIDTAVRMEYMQNIKAQASQAKADQQSDKAYTDMRKGLETFRGNQAAQQAAKNVLSAQNAIQLVGNKDPNTLTTQDLSLLSSEIGKIATGGVPTEHGMQALMPNNFATKWAELQNLVTSKPTDAQAAAYINKNMNYLKDMQAIAQQTLSSFRSNIAKGYKNRVKPEDYQEAMDDYGLGTPPPKSEVVRASNKIMVSNGKETLKIDPEDLPHAMADGYQQVR